MVHTNIVVRPHTFKLPTVHYIMHEFMGDRLFLGYKEYRSPQTVIVEMPQALYGWRLKRPSDIIKRRTIRFR